MKLATWNVNSLRVRLPHLLDWLKAAQPDVVGLQELKCTDEQFPFDDIRAAGYHAVANGQKTYNGVAILSRIEPTAVSRDVPGFDDVQKRVIAATVGELRFINVYVVNGQDIGTEKYAYKLRWLESLRGYLTGELATHPQLALVGDFNVAPTPADTHDPDVWEDHILCSEPERAAYRALLDLGLHDSFEHRADLAQRFTWWDYRQGAFPRNYGLRIDHVLLSAPLAARCTGWAVDTGPRELERPSDHAPVVASLKG